MHDENWTCKPENCPTCRGRAFCSEEEPQREADRQNNNPTND